MARRTGGRAAEGDLTDAARGGAASQPAQQGPFSNRRTAANTDADEKLTKGDQDNRRI
jgi:hypothetical protein